MKGGAESTFLFSPVTVSLFPVALSFGANMLTLSIENLINQS